MKTIILQSLIEICSMQNDILYEIYDSVLQYVQFSAYSHNFQTNNLLNLFRYNEIYCRYHMFA